MGFAGAAADAWPRPRAFPRPEALERSVDSLPGVGPAVKKKLAKLGLERVGDLLEHQPFRYVSTTHIADLFEDGEEVAIEGKIGRLSVRKARRGLTIVEGTVLDESGKIRVTWFNQPWVADQLAERTQVQLARGRGALRPMGPAVDHHAARPADSLAAIVVERDRLLAAPEQLLVQDVEQLEKRHVGAGVRHIVPHEGPGGAGAGLPPYV